MNKLVTFGRSFVRSISDPSYYAEIAKANFSFSFKYFFFLNFICALLTTAMILVPLAAFDLRSAVQSTVDTFPSDLVIDIDLGVLTINQPLPYRIDVPSDDVTTDAVQSLVVFDTNAAVAAMPNLESYSSMFIVTETKVYVMGDDDRSGSEVKVYPIPEDMESVTISSAVIRQLANGFLDMPAIRNKWYVPLIGLFAFLLVLPLFVWIRFMTAAIYAGFVFVILRMAKSYFGGTEWRYSKALQVSLHSLTPVIVAAYALTILQVGWFSGWTYFFVYLIFTLVMIKMSKSKADEVAPMALALTPVKEPVAAKPKRARRKK